MGGKDIPFSKAGPFEGISLLMIPRRRTLFFPLQSIWGFPKYSPLRFKWDVSTIDSWFWTPSSKMMVLFGKFVEPLGDRASLEEVQHSGRKALRFYNNPTSCSSSAYWLWIDDDQQAASCSHCCAFTTVMECVPWNCELKRNLSSFKWLIAPVFCHKNKKGDNNTPSPPLSRWGHNSYSCHYFSI